MSGVPIDIATARIALGTATRRAELLLGSIVDTTVATRGLEWTLGETAAHLVGDVRRFGDILHGRVVPDGGVEGVAAINETHLIQVAERNPAALARLFSDAVATFLRESDKFAGTEPVAWYGGHEINAAAITCLVLGEVLVHGYDVAMTTGQPWPIDAADARLVLDGAIWALPSMVDSRAARGVRATFDVRVRGGSRAFLRFQDGSLTVEPGRRGGADCTISADPVALLLVGYGRTGQWGAIATGQLVAWGRKPWLGLKFVSLVRNP